MPAVRVGKIIDAPQPRRRIVERQGRIREAAQ
jgi:hypothetical protein